MEGRSLYVVTALQMVAVALVLWLLFSRPGPWDWQRCAGAALVVTGIAGVVTARYHLGKSFAIKAQAHELVTHGIYSKIRNPIYVFGAVAMTGFALVLHRPVFWLILAAIAVLQILRARRETKVLEAAFGDAYREYRRQTWF
jgi:protein-S-isoprenylcysteine O-methyltransferase Ste14